MNLQTKIENTKKMQSLLTMGLNQLRLSKTSIFDTKSTGLQQDNSLPVQRAQLLFVAPFSDPASIALFSPAFEREEGGEMEERDDQGGNTEGRKTTAFSSPNSLSYFLQLPRTPNSNCGMCMIVRFFVLSCSLHGGNEMENTTKFSLCEKERKRENSINCFEDIEMHFIQKQKKFHPICKDTDANTDESVHIGVGAGENRKKRGSRELVSCGFENGEVWFFDLYYQRFFFTIIFFLLPA